MAEPQEYFVMRSRRGNTLSLGCANLVKTLRLEGTEMKSYNISSSFEELSKTLELVSDPVARLVLSKRITADLAGQGIEVNFGASYG